MISAPRYVSGTPSVTVGAAHIPERGRVYLTAAHRTDLEHMTASGSEHLFELHLEFLQELKRHESLYSSREAAAVNS